MTGHAAFRANLESARAGALAALEQLAQQRDPSPETWVAVEQVFKVAGEELGLAIRDSVDIKSIEAQANAFGLKLVYSKRVDYEGGLIPSAKGLIVHIPRWQPLTRARATLAHELGHSFFWIKRRGRPERLLRYINRFEGETWEERVCWTFARSYLMPKKVVRAWIALSPRPQADVVRGIAESNVISLDVLFSRFRDEKLLSRAALGSTYRLADGTQRVASFLGDDASRFLVQNGVQNPPRYIETLLSHRTAIKSTKQFFEKQGFDVSVWSGSSDVIGHDVVAAYIQEEEKTINVET